MGAPLLISILNGNYTVKIHGTTICHKTIMPFSNQSTVVGGNFNGIKNKAFKGHRRGMGGDVILTIALNMDNEQIRTLQSSLYGMATINFYSDNSAQNLCLSLKSATLISNTLVMKYIGHIHKGPYTKLNISYLFIGLSPSLG